MRRRLDPKDLSEKQFSRQVYDAATSFTWKRYHTYRSERSPAGWPDEAFVHHRIFFAELKVEQALTRKEKKPTPLQQEWLSAIARAGGEVYLWIPSDLEEIVEILRHRWTWVPSTVVHGGRGWLERGGTRWTPGSLWLPEGGRADGKVIEPPSVRAAKEPLTLPIP